MKVFHEEIGGMVEGPALFEGQDEWVRKQDALDAMAGLERDCCYVGAQLTAYRMAISHAMDAIKT